MRQTVQCLGLLFRRDYHNIILSQNRLGEEDLRTLLANGLIDSLGIKENLANYVNSFERYSIFLF